MSDNGSCERAPDRHATATTSVRAAPPLTGDAAVVAVNGVSKHYPGVQALEGVSLDLRAGEVHALVGENGAGKSTLIRILSGDVRPDRGTVAVRGREVSFDSPAAARRSGIVTIFQELMIVTDMSVAENIVLGDEPGVGPLRQVYSRRQAEQVASKVLESLGQRAAINPRQLAARLSTGHRQIVEIARALIRRAPVIILDEPTAALSDNESEVLLRILGQLRAEGAGILFVSHRLEEVRKIADRITVLRGGRHIATLPAAEVTSTGHLIELMIGRPLNEMFPPRNTKIGDVVFSVQGATRRGVFEDVSFDVRAGEVVGFAGLIGAGRTEVMRAIFGADKLDAGTLFKNGRPLRISAPPDAMAAGIAYLPEDRKTQGLVLSLSGYENLMMSSLERYSPFGIMLWRTATAAAREVARRLQFRGNLSAPAMTSSGGNQQKLVIGKWALSAADVLIFDEPTRGIDIAAKAEIYRLIHELAGAGAAVIVVSSEIIELTKLCHRIFVMSGGRVCDHMDAEEFDERRILSAAFTAHVATASPPSASRAAAGAATTGC
jgi:ABC-type sugar transport system ATPase subunit